MLTNTQLDYAAANLKDSYPYNLLLDIMDKLDPDLCIFNVYIPALFDYIEKVDFCNIIEKVYIQKESLLSDDEKEELDNMLNYINKHMSEFEIDFEYTPTITYEEYLYKAYDRYKQDWCNQRGYKLEDVELAESEDLPYHDEMYVCLDEFEDNEFLDESYMYYLMKDEYACWA